VEESAFVFEDVPQDLQIVAVVKSVHWDLNTDNLALTIWIGKKKPRRAWHSQRRIQGGRSRMGQDRTNIDQRPAGFCDLQGGQNRLSATAANKRLSETSVFRQPLLAFLFGRFSRAKKQFVIKLLLPQFHSFSEFLQKTLPEVFALYNSPDSAE
jgi:hypothetical protein